MKNNLFNISNTFILKNINNYKCTNVARNKTGKVIAKYKVYETYYAVCNRYTIKLFSFKFKIDIIIRVYEEAHLAKELNDLLNEQLN